ncbi:MAG: hypothetical protein D6775_10905 [Caldilineae bacterium]|nr:MAG: hypothetical protein D6775_10905 [Caldilineae bacterium]
MSKKKSSAEGSRAKKVGRGVDALFSDTREGTARRRAARKSPPPATEPTRDAEAELESMLEAEARAATTGSDTEAPAVAGEGVTLTDEELLDAIDVPPGGHGPAKEGGEERGLPVTVEEIRPAAPPREEEPTPEPSPLPKREKPRKKPERPSASESTEVPPSRPRVYVMGKPSEVNLDRPPGDSVRPQSPFIRPEPPPLEETPLPEHTPEEEATLRASLDYAKIAELHKRIDLLYDKVPKFISNRPADTEQILGTLRQARTILIENPEDFVIAEYKIQQAMSLYNRIENSEKWGDVYGWRVFYFEVVVFFLLLASFVGLLAFGTEFSNFLARLFGVENPGQEVLTAIGFWSTLVWGGIGGVVGALYILWTHVSQRQDFERQHVMWYIGQPIMGLILGGVTFLIINAGLLSLQGGQVAAQSLRTEPQFFPALIAFIAGFRPQFIFGLLVKIINVISPGGESGQQ